MELVGLQCQMQFFAEQDIPIDTLIADRHLGVNKWLRESCPAVQHEFDMWHVAKGLKKKILKKAGLKGNEAMWIWMKPMTTHMYNCVMASTSQEQLEAQWRSVELHITNEVNI